VTLYHASGLRHSLVRTLLGALLELKTKNEIAMNQRATLYDNHYAQKTRAGVCGYLSTKDRHPAHETTIDLFETFHKILA
jgi:hypothetical protein